MALAAIQALPAPDAAAWQIIGDEGLADVAIDPASVERRQTRVRVAIRVRFLDRNRPGLLGAIMRYDFDCAAGRYRAEHVQAYDRTGLLAPEPPAAGDQPIRRDTSNQRVRDYLCAR